MNYILFLFFLFFFLWFVLYIGFQKDIIAHRSTYQLEKHGVVVYKNVLSPEEITDLRNKCAENQYKEIKDHLTQHPKLIQIIQKETADPANYVFQDYIWIIKKSSVHTCHRDNNGDFFNKNQKHTSYTMLVYLENMDKCLGVVPTSHKDVNSFGFNLSDPVVNLLCNQGDVILFDANLIHVGTFNQRENNPRIQLKVSHREDLETLSYYQNYHKVLDEENSMPLFIRKAQRALSCMAPIVSNYTQSENIRTSNVEDSRDIGFLQKMFSYLFYGNPNYYHLPNAF